MPALDDYITDVLLRDLVGHDRRPVSFLVYLWLAAEHARRGATVQIGYQELAENIGISKSSVQAAVSWLCRRKLLATFKENATAVPRYTVLTPWKASARPNPPRHLEGLRHKPVCYKPVTLSCRTYWGERKIQFNTSNSQKQFNS